VTAYPLADLIVIALMVRLMFGGGARNPAFLFMLASLGGFLIADVGWSVVIRASSPPTPAQQHFLEMASMSAYALMGASALHPSTREIAPTPQGQPIRLGWLGWAALGISALTAPTVIIIQAVLDHLYSLNSF
jgi:diguanylate cyclase